MDLGFIQDYYIPVVLVACLVVGYCIKPVSYTHLDVYKRQELKIIPNWRCR